MIKGQVMDKQKTGTYIHESAMAHANTLTHILDNYDVGESEIRRSISQMAQLPKSNLVVSDSPATKVAQMKTTDGLADNLRRELTCKSFIANGLPPVVGTYSPISLQFENSSLFLPSAVEFLHANEDTVKEYFPEANITTVNSFSVAPNKHAFGVHNAGSVGFEVPSFAKQGLAYPKQHLSFHTALTPTPLDRQPFCIFEDVVPECPNLPYLYNALQNFDLTEEERKKIDKFYYICISRVITAFDITGARNYLMCKYFEKTYGTPETKSSGYFWDLEPGQAVFFDNYKLHGDSTLPLSNEERLTIDLRCYSKVEYPEGMNSGIDLLTGEDRKRRVKAKSSALDCILRIVGYRDLDEFLDLVYGRNRKEIDVFDMMTDPQFGVYNRSKHYILDQNLDGHFEKINKLYEQIERDGEFVMPKKQHEEITRLSRTY